MNDAIRNAKTITDIRKILKQHVASGGKLGRGVDRAARHALAKLKARKFNGSVEGLNRLFGIA